MKIIKHAMIVAAVLGTASAVASEPDTLYITAPVGSYHIDRKHDFNEHNYGAGVEYNGWMAGAFRNSFYKDTVYAGYAWRPIKAGPVSAGVAVAAATGYDTPVIAYASIAIEHKGYGAELIATPPVSGTNHKGMIGLQLRFAFH